MGGGCLHLKCQMPPCNIFKWPILTDLYFFLRPGNPQLLPTIANQGRPRLTRPIRGPKWEITACVGACPWRLILVFDFGGGTYDCSLVSAIKDNIEVWTLLWLWERESIFTCNLKKLREISCLLNPIPVPWRLPKRSGSKFCVLIHCDDQSFA